MERAEDAQLVFFLFFGVTHAEIVGQEGPEFIGSAGFILSSAETTNRGSSRLPGGFFGDGNCQRDFFAQFLEGGTSDNGLLSSLEVG